MPQGFSIKIFNNSISIQSPFLERNDNLLIQNEMLEIGLEGLVLNKKKLLNQYAMSDFSTLILELYQNKKENWIQELEGEFRGFVYDKLRAKCFVFTNPTATQRVFYYKKDTVIWVDSHLNRLVAQLKNDNVKPEPNIVAIYQLICIGNMLEGTTPVQGVKKILDGQYIDIGLTTQNIVQKEYYSAFSSPRFVKSKDKALQSLHELFEDSVVMEYSKDTELGKKSLALLSGGLDSRLGVMYAVDNGLLPENILCFSQSGYWDHLISKKIAKDLHLHYEFIPLDGGSFLSKIDQLTSIAEGCGLFTGGIHVQHAMDKLVYQNFGIFHSGQIGDGILGGFNSEPFKKKPSYFKIVQNNAFLPAIEEDLKEIMKRYETEESFLLRNIAYNRTVLGAQVLQQKAYQTSPFMSKEILSFAFSLPEEWKFGHRLYLEWIANYCPQATQYRWERTLLKPNAYWKTRLGDRFLKPIFKKVNEKILKTPQKSSMYPYAYYFQQSNELQKVYHNYWEENIDRLSRYPELQSDVRKLYASQDFFQKCRAINVLSVFKLFFDA